MNGLHEILEGELTLVSGPNIRLDLENGHRGFCAFFSERELMFNKVRYMLSPFRLSVCLSVTLVHPTQPVEIFRNFYSPYGTLAIHWHPLEILLRSS